MPEMSQRDRLARVEAAIGELAHLFRESGAFRR